MEVSGMDQLWIFIEHGQHKTWTRAAVPNGIQAVKELINYLQRGGQVESEWIDLPERAKYTLRSAGMTVIATLMEMEKG
jgi:hypothetical protein